MQAVHPPHLLAGIDLDDQRTFVIATKDVVDVLGLPPMFELISADACEPTCPG